MTLRDCVIADWIARRSRRMRDGWNVCGFLQEIIACKHGRKSRGDGGRIPPEFAMGGRLYRLSPQIFVVFQNFKRSPWIRPPRFQPRFTPLRVRLQVLATCEI
jgi:hypothetical protein